jgi:hypothetical protein
MVTKSDGNEASWEPFRCIEEELSMPDAWPDWECQWDWGKPHSLTVPVFPDWGLFSEGWGDVSPVDDVQVWPRW